MGSGLRDVERRWLWSRCLRLAQEVGSEVDGRQVRELVSGGFRLGRRGFVKGGLRDAIRLRSRLRVSGQLV